MKDHLPLTIGQPFSVRHEYAVHFTRDALGAENPVLAHVLAAAGNRRHRLLPVIDAGVLRSTPRLPAKLSRYAERHGELMELVAPPFSIRGGEDCKRGLLEVEKIQGLIERHHLCRQSFLLVIGGGAVLDAAGFAAATAHRGIRLLRLPTTVLAQNDAGVGVKNGINAFGRKNFLGTFAPPFAVINDFDFLKTLPARDVRAGIAEAVKVALVKDPSFFDFLYRERKRLAVFAAEPLEKMIIRCAELHLNHIVSQGDAFESGSSRPLDFGHWAAHKLEEMTDGSLRHGEAVAVGIALDALYSFRRGLLSEIEQRRIMTTLRDIGFDLFHPLLHRMEVEEALADFQEHLGGERRVPMLKAAGVVAEVHEIDADLMRRCIDELAILSGRPAAPGPGEDEPARPQRRIAGEIPRRT